MRARDVSQFRSCVAALRKALPPKYPVRVRRVAVGGGAWGDCGLSGGRKPYFVIRVHKDATAHLAQETLMHEWAHCLSWANESHPSFTEHDEIWGVCYSRVWRAIYPDKDDAA